MWLLLRRASPSYYAHFSYYAHIMSFYINLRRDGAQGLSPQPIPKVKICQRSKTLCMYVNQSLQPFPNTKFLALWENRGWCCVAQWIMLLYLLTMSDSPFYPWLFQNSLNEIEAVSNHIFGVMVLDTFTHKSNSPSVTFQFHIRVWYQLFWLGEDLRCLSWKWQFDEVDGCRATFCQKQQQIETGQ